MTDEVVFVPGQLKIRRYADAYGVVLALRGEVDLGSAAEFERELRAVQETRPDRIVVDLSGLDFMDSTGITVLVRAQQAADADGQLLVLRRGPDQVQRLFQLTGLVDRFMFLD